MSAPKYTRDLLVRTVAESVSMVDLMRRLGIALGSGPHAYLKRRLRHYGIDTSHFHEESLPERKRRSYPRELLAEAAAHSHSIREVLEYMDLPPHDSPYGHIRKKLDQYGIDASHFTRGRRYEAGILDRNELVAAVGASFSVSATLKLLGRADNGASRALVKRSIEAHGISVEHFTGQGHFLGTASPRRKPAAEILTRLAPSSPRTRTVQLRRALDDLGLPHQCAACGLGDVWQGKRLVLEIDHINGDRLDNRRENLRYLCPSCHSQTGTFANRPRPPLTTQ
ncbi:HNH endonuclease signature motif containing protein [Streptomyces sp. NPDC058770]|uniref:HNH endonuclease signature motif containing protein n=1 Tax=Streptomyces sp. NPDC058770 TaxID=3346631 RepID=UPI0036C8FA38